MGLGQQLRPFFLFLFTEVRGRGLSPKSRYGVPNSNSLGDRHTSSQEVLRRAYRPQSMRAWMSISVRYRRNTVTRYESDSTKRSELHFCAGERYFRGTLRANNPKLTPQRTIACLEAENTATLVSRAARYAPKFATSSDAEAMARIAYLSDAPTRSTWKVHCPRFVGVVYNVRAHKECSRRRRQPCSPARTP